MIQFQNKEFLTRILNLPEFGEVLISTTSLNDLLLGDDDYTSDKALAIDEEVFYFVEDEQIELPYNELRDLVILEVR
ncbi:hypothetical protein FMM05_16180 [Flavobacterium zepuense]|uniref:Uncharacterized protein n=1 Tax=Flavobacterium zepuense TaxID=2593302 RepID=A0A552UX40_9FLAO|nr:hypothetical protein [Flavobacterium zepuense]TRW22794.1 hypothetical protein FMM05_16180 [Flavobacterium zepuense]